MGDEHRTPSYIGGAAVDGRTLTQAYRYDLVGQAVSVTDERGTETTYEYDELSRPIAVTRDDGSRFRTEYDAVGNVVRMRDANGTVIATDYTPRYQIDTVGYTGNGRTETVDYTYDEAGGLRTTTTGGITTRYNHNDGSYRLDVYGRVRELATEIDGVAFGVGYRYDAADRVATVRYGAGPTAAEIDYAWDTLGRLRGIEGFVETGSTSYDGRLYAGSRYENRLMESRTYDQLGRLSTQSCS